MSSSILAVILEWDAKMWGNGIKIKDFLVVFVTLEKIVFPMIVSKEIFECYSVHDYKYLYKMLETRETIKKVSDMTKRVCVAPNKASSFEHFYEIREGFQLIYYYYFICIQKFIVILLTLFYFYGKCYLYSMLIFWIYFQSARYKINRNSKHFLCVLFRINWFQRIFFLIFYKKK